ncbi:ABC transporter ATP-binding protein [Pseudalgibacter alginicilyticus]|uniref:ABC transporter ATP-binding protein n=1 Tax=Pseudalgibacter alginicilyticus TaxID=1736674 RepID=A0A0P0CPR8_9FLAO|nr:ABC transporter ATP-binding protein [Pseudalgibacter alginicilyticus]ALJ04843.1 ABC transporter ATP-binding protein [Pseudalgibacter alginicilyticus]
MTPIIKLENLSKKYGTFYAVNKLNLNIYKGEVFGLLGPNGAGKSTTILMMLGLTEPQSGKALICGFDATTNPIQVKKRVGYLPDTLGFYENRTGLENLIYIAHLNGLSEQITIQKAKELLIRVGLEKEMNKKVSTYSRGMKQRLGLADVLIKNPEIIILDEPTLGIDPKGVRDFLLLIRQLSKEEHLTVLLSSHNLHQVQQVCDRVGLFVDGNLIAEGDIPTLSKVLLKEQSYTVEIKLQESLQENSSIIKTLLLKSEDIKKVTLQNDSLLIYCTNDVTSYIAKTLINANFNMQYLHIKEYGLDDIYQRYFENKNENNKQIA